MASSRLRDRLKWVPFAIAALGCLVLLLQLVWLVRRAQQFIPSTDFEFTEGELQIIREVTTWQAVRVSLLWLTTFIIALIPLALYASKRLRLGAVRWWTNLERVRSVIDALAKTAAVVGVIAAVDILTLAPKLQDTYICETLLDLDVISDAYPGEFPAEVEDAFSWDGAAPSATLEGALRRT